MPQRKASTALAKRRASQVRGTAKAVQSARADKAKFMGSAKRVSSKPKLPGAGAAAKASASSAAKVARVAGRIAAPVAVATTGFEVGKAIGTKVRTGKAKAAQRKKVATMTKASFEENKDKRQARGSVNPVKMATTSERLKSISKKQAVAKTGRAGTAKKAPANAKPKAPTSKPRTANTVTKKAMANKKVRANSGKRKPAPVQSGPSRKAVTAKKKANRGYANYEEIMKDVGN